MACRGVHFALSDDELASLLNSPTDGERKRIVQEEIEERWDEAHSLEMDKAWDAIHRCLTDGTLRPGDPYYPLNLCILGGKQLYAADDYIISLVMPSEVGRVAHALARTTKSDLREHYFNIRPEAYGLPITEEDFEYTWAYFEDLEPFFAMASAEGRAVIFTVDQ